MYNTHTSITTTLEGSYKYWILNSHFEIVAFKRLPNNEHKRLLEKKLRKQRKNLEVK